MRSTNSILKNEVLRLPFPSSLWNSLSTFSCLNISTCSQNGMLIDVMHKLGYHSSNLIRFPVFIYCFWSPFGGIKIKGLSYGSSFPQLMYPKEASSFHPFLWWPSGSYSSFSPGPWNNMYNYFLGKPATYLTLPTGETHRLSPFWCDYLRKQGLAWPSPMLGYIL